MEDDTIKLLRECDSGIQMGIASINEVLNYVENESFKKLLTDCRTESEHLKDEIEAELSQYHEDKKGPNPVAKGMSWMKTNVMLIMKQSDRTIADLMTEGCNMGVKSLHKYLNQYRAASQKAKDLAKQLARSEEKLAIDIRPFL